jgi:hypothetical protein
MKRFFTLTVIILTIAYAICCQGCKENRIPTQEDVKYSVVGRWVIDKVWIGSIYIREKITLTFTGTMDDGTVTSDKGGNGTYTAGGEKGLSIRFNLTFYENGSTITEFYEGEFSEENHMSGTFALDNGWAPDNGGGQWGANRL